MTQLGSMYPLPTVSAVAQAVSRAVGVSIPATLGGASDLAADVRALFTANGGDFTGTMLDFTKTSRLFSDLAGTPAAAESTLALVLDDSQNGAQSAVTVTGLITGALNLTSFAGDQSDDLSAQFSVGDWLLITVTVSDYVSGTLQLGTGAQSDVANRAFPAITADGTYTVYWRATATTIDYRGGGGTASFEGTLTLDVVDVTPGAHAYQATAGSRPKSTTDAFGTRVAQPDGSDDYMNLPDGVLGDGTQHVHVFAAYSYNGVDSDSAARLLTGVGGAGVQLRHDGTPSFQDVVTTGSITSATSAVYARALTDNETLIRAAVFDPVSTVYGRANGVEVLSTTHGYGSLDDPGAGKIFGDTTNNSLAGTCHGIVILTGSRAMTAAEIATVEAYLADLASDPLLTADADTVLSRVFRPATDLNVTESFATADWTDNSAGSSSITVNAGSNVTFNVVGADAAIADRTFRTRVGFRYTITSTSSVGVTVSADESTAGGTTYGTGASISFVATTSTVYVRASTTTNADTLTALAISESAATGDYWDMLDATKRFTDAGSTQAGANQQVQQINSVEGDYPLTQSTLANRATLDGTATNLVYDGSNDYYVATDAADDLVQAGATTEIWAVTPDVSASNRVISSAGDSTVATDTASVFSINGSDQLSLQQADASNTETEATAITVTEGSVNVVSFVRSGAGVDFGIGANQVESETFATVTSPTAGASPAFNVGISVDQSSDPYDGSIQAGVKFDRASATGLLLHCIRALQEKTA